MLLRNEGSIKRPRGLSVLYCPFSDGTPRKLLKIASMVRVFWGFAEVSEFEAV
jgi:hypothetical protein